MPGRIDRLNPNIKRHSLTKETQNRLKKILQLFRSMNHQLTRTPQHTQSRDQAWQTKTMIAMQMRDENMRQPTEFQVGMTYLQLRVLSTIDHVQLIPKVNHLRSR